MEFDTLVKASILGSGSAPRSLLGGFVILNSGDQLSCEKILQPDDWPLTVIICITDNHEKSISSREGMEISKRTSPTNFKRKLAIWVTIFKGIFFPK